MSDLPRVRVLVIDDNSVDRERIRRMVGSRYDILEADSAGSGLAAAAVEAVDCVLLDYRLPDQDGTTVLGALAALNLPVVMLTAQGSEAVAVDAMKHGAMDYLRKGAFDGDTLRLAVESALDRARLARELEKNRAALEEAMHALQLEHAHLERVHALSERRAHELSELLSQVPAVVWRTDASAVEAVFSGAARDAWLAEPGGAHQEATAIRLDNVAAWADARPSPLVAHQRALEGFPSEFEVTWCGRAYNARVQALRDPEGRPFGVVGAAFDTTTLRLLERQFRATATLEAVGRVSTSIAHDFNNVLQAVMNAAVFAADELPADHPARAAIDDILTGARRGAALTRSITALVRPAGSRVAPLVVNDAVASALPLLRRLAGPGIQISFDPADDPWISCVGSAGVDQLVLNLVVNARDAMPDGGSIDIQTRNLDADPSSPSDLGWIRLRVRDSGVGIPANAVEHIFEPFFTTKGDGRGTGLGLATCRDVVHAAGGSISVRAGDGGGTTFDILLPRYLDPDDPAPLHGA